MMNTKNKKRARGAGRIFQRGKTAWVQFYDGRGQQVRANTGIEILCEADEKKVEKILRKKLGEVEAGIHVDTRRITYENLRERLYTDYEINARKSLRRKDGRPHLDKVARLDTFFSGFRSSEIDADLIRKFIKAEQERGLAGGTINRSVAALRHMFHLAKRDGELRDIPYFFPMVQESKARQGFFERAEYEALSQSLPDYLRLPLALGFFTAMRLGEILGLEWNQIDFLAGSINLRAGETKNDLTRTIPIVPQLRAFLIEQRAKRQAHCPYVCFRLDPKGQAIKIGSFRKVWQSRCVKLGLGKMEPAKDRTTREPLYAAPRGPRSKPKAKMTYKGMIFHDLRRTGVRNLVRAGVSEKVARDISGHKTRSVFDRYNIVSPSDVTEAGRKLAAFHDVGDNSGTNDMPAVKSNTVIN